MRAFEQDPLASADGPVHQESGIGREGEETRRQAGEELCVLLERGALAASQELEQPVGARDPFGQQSTGAIDMAQVDHPDAAPAVRPLAGLMPVPWCRCSGSLAGGVEQLVEWQHQVRTIGHERPAVSTPRSAS